MIARGDLAVEIGFQRLAEMQEEILWICEAAHVPVIWATQFWATQLLENLAAMLNKGPYIGEAVSTLGDILQRMQQHHHHKTSLMRALQSWND